MIAHVFATRNLFKFFKCVYLVIPKCNLIVNQLVHVNLVFCFVFAMARDCCKGTSLTVFQAGLTKGTAGHTHTHGFGEAFLFPDERAIMSPAAWSESSLTIESLDPASCARSKV